MIALDALREFQENRKKTEMDLNQIRLDEVAKIQKAVGSDLNKHMKRQSSIIQSIQASPGFKHSLSHTLQMAMKTSLTGQIKLMEGNPLINSQIEKIDTNLKEMI
jgi:DNA transposition AAA+ family ATPase